MGYIKLNFDIALLMRPLHNTVLVLLEVVGRSHKVLLGGKKTLLADKMTLENC